jgi:membrane associated rhomboid family serine protease
MAFDKEKAKALTKKEFSRIVRGLFEYKRIFLVYFVVLILSITISISTQAFPRLESVLSASRETPWGVITSLFSHSSIPHIALNMGSLLLFFLLFAFCNSTFLSDEKKKIEKYLLFSIFLIAIISNIAWVVLTSNLTVGASGLVYAVQGSLAGFALINGLQLFPLSRLKFQSLATLSIIIVNILVFTVSFLQILLDTGGFLSVGQGVNIIAHGLSFILGLFGSVIWYHFVGKISLLDKSNITLSSGSIMVEKEKKQQ